MPRNAFAYEVSKIEFGAPAGAYQFTRYGDAPNVVVGIIHSCPCGCGQLSSLYFEGKGRGRPEWKVSGVWPKVSITPSIGFWGTNTKEQGFHWHGYLTDGEFREC
jgi:hypothetical protein